MIYLFLDLETTGLDPDKDFILEIAWLFADSGLTQIGSGRSFVIDQDDWVAMRERFNQAPAVVQDMHRESKLIQDLNRSSDLLTLNEVYSTLLLDISACGDEQSIHLAGNSIHFDKGFLIANDFGGLFTGPRAVLHHRMLDVSALKLLWESAEVPFPKAMNATRHRALNDVFESLEQARIFKKLVQYGEHQTGPKPRNVDDVSAEAGTY